MKRRGYAYFVESPRILEDLIVPHPVEMERQYRVVKTIRLSKIDYESFITDMIADRSLSKKMRSSVRRGLSGIAFLFSNAAEKTECLFCQ